MIKAEKLSKNFNQMEAVNGVSLEVARGDIFGLVGPDGAGKTTLLRMICGLIKPSGGTVKLFDCCRDEASKSNQTFGYMPQKFSLYGDLTVMENIIFFGSMYNLDRAIIRQRADEILEITNLIAFKGRFADDLSGGMKQKLALTCALVSRPSLLVLDEPTFGVDPESRKEFWKILYQLNSKGMTVLVSTPYMDEAELCQRVAFMESGKLVAVDTPVGLKDSFPYRVLELRANTRDPFIFQPVQGIKEASFFGDKYRLLVESTGTEERVILSYLSEIGVEVISLKEVPPSMEDVYVALSEEEVS